jgi:hypothetical protein
MLNAGWQPAHLFAHKRTHYSYFIHSIDLHLGLSLAGRFELLVCFFFWVGGGDKEKPKK